MDQIWLGTLWTELKFQRAFGVDRTSPQLFQTEPDVLQGRYYLLLISRKPPWMWHIVCVPNAGKNL